MADQLKPAQNNEPEVVGNRQGFQPAPVVLVVEDDPAVRQFLETALRRFGFDIRSAVNGAEALEIYQRGGIGVVLMDVQMPLLDGPKTLARLKEIDPNVVCCLMSAHFGEYDFVEIMNLGAIGLLQKPFNLEQLRQIVMGAIK